MGCSFRVSAAVLAAAVFSISCVLTAQPAAAKGTITIHRKDGSLQTASDIEIKIFSGSLFLTSDDGKGTIVVNKAACSLQGQVMMCLPSSIALVQDGESTAMNVKSGTIYANNTYEAQPMSFTSAKIPARSVMVSFTTMAGTFVSVVGTVDEVVNK